MRKIFINQVSVKYNPHETFSHPRNYICGKNKKICGVQNKIRAKINPLDVILKELRNFILCIFRAWSLSNTDWQKSTFSTYFCRKIVYGLSVFYIFCLFCFEVDVICQSLNFLHIICVIIVYEGTKWSVIFFSLREFLNKASCFHYV